MKFEVSNFQEVQLTAEELQLLRTLVHFQEVVQEAAERFSPSTLATYLFELAQVFNLFYQKVPILTSEEKEKELRLFLTFSVGHAIRKGLNLLGIDVPERM